MRKSTSIMRDIEAQSYVPMSSGRFGTPSFRLTRYRARERQRDGAVVWEAVVWEAVDRRGRVLSYRQVRAEQQATGCRVGGIHGQVVSYDEAVDCVGERSARYLRDSGFIFD